MFTSRLTIDFTNDTIFSFSFQTCAKSSRCRLTLSPWSWEARSSSGATRRRASQSQGWAILNRLVPRYPTGIYSEFCPYSSGHHEDLFFFYSSSRFVILMALNHLPIECCLWSAICPHCCGRYVLSYSVQTDNHLTKKKLSDDECTIIMSIIFSDLLGARRCGGAAGERPKLFAGLGRSPHNRAGVINKILSRAKLSWRGYMRLVPSDKATNLTILSQ